MKAHKYLKVTILNIFIILGIIFSSAGNSRAVFQKEDDPYPLFFLQKNLTAILINDNISPPAAARDYVYPQLAAYYILSLQVSGKKIYDSIRHFPHIRLGDKEVYSRSLAAAYAFYEVARKIIYTEQPFVDSFPVLLDWYTKKGLTPSLFAPSKKMGEAVAEQIIQWMNGDGFIETRRMNKYVLQTAPGKWQPTAPGYFAAVEPHWGEIRPLFISTMNGLQRFSPKLFDTAVQSKYYQEAKKVYDIASNLTNEQKQIAAFWDCNPFALRTSGHVQQFVKKMSPGAHWLHIAEIACKKKQLGIKEASRVLALTAATIFDAFIQTWGMKYEFSSIRPETFIQQSGMDAGWQPFIQCPPFPEFPSGHAVISSASASVLTNFFGAGFQYTDDTETFFGLPIRNFRSFKEAAAEASISRVYGGIHYPSSCITGERIGEKVAYLILQKTTLKK